MESVLQQLYSKNLTTIYFTYMFLERRFKSLELPRKWKSANKVIKFKYILNSRVWTRNDTIDDNCRDAVRPISQFLA